MGTVNLGQVAALIKSVAVEVLPEGATPTVRNDGTKANAELVFGIPDTKNIIINILKNGYIQWPGMPSPLEDTSLHFEGYSWYEVNYDGNFFRAKGRNAKAFSAKKLTKEQIKKGAYIFQDDEQVDAIRRLTANLHALMSFHKDVPGYFKESPWETDFRWGASSPDRLYGVNISKHIDVDGVVAEENRSRNLTFTIWVLVKD